MIHAEKDTGGRKLEPGKWRKEALKVYPFSLTIFSCPKCGFRQPVEAGEDGKMFEVICLDNKCGFRDMVSLDGLEAIATVENGGKVDG